MRHLTIYRLYFTESDCYNRAIKQTSKGIQVHDTGTNNPYLKRWVQPDDGRLGVNPNNNSHNKPGGNVCASAYIGKLQDDTVAVYQTLPWNYRCWLSGSIQREYKDSSGNTKIYKGNANNMGYVGFEICRDNMKNQEYFYEAVCNQSVLLTAYLCQLFGVTPDTVLYETPFGPAYAVMDHSNLYKVSCASNHDDIGEWLKVYGYTFNDYRNWVQDALNEGVEVTYIDAKEESPMDNPILRKGSYGSDVSYLQTLLQKTGSTISVDGSFGAKTEEAVKEFQRKHGLTVDGVVGKNTWNKLLEATKDQNAVEYIQLSFDDWNELIESSDSINRIINKYNSVG